MRAAFWHHASTGGCQRCSSTQCRDTHCRPAPSPEPPPPHAGVGVGEETPPAVDGHPVPSLLAYSHASAGQERRIRHPPRQPPPISPAPWRAPAGKGARPALATSSPCLLAFEACSPALPTPDWPLHRSAPSIRRGPQLVYPLPRPAPPPGGRRPGLRGQRCTAPLYPAPPSRRAQGSPRALTRARRLAHGRPCPHQKLPQPAPPGAARRARARGRPRNAPAPPHHWLEPQHYENAPAAPAHPPRPQRQPPYYPPPACPLRCTRLLALRPLPHAPITRRLRVPRPGACPPSGSPTLTGHAGLAPARPPGPCPKTEARPRALCAPLGMGAPTTNSGRGRAACTHTLHPSPPAAAVFASTGAPDAPARTPARPAPNNH
jgi:hypothetical protein